MKKVILLSAISISILSFSFNTIPAERTNGSLSSASASDFAFFRAHRMGKDIELTWGMSNNNPVAEFMILKTMQDPNDPYSVWDMVAFVGPATDHNYKCCDTNVLPGTSSYKVVAWYTNEGSATSDIVSVTIKGGH